MHLAAVWSLRVCDLENGRSASSSISSGLLIQMLMDSGSETMAAVRRREAGLPVPVVVQGHVDLVRSSHSPLTSSELGLLV